MEHLCLDTPEHQETLGPPKYPMHQPLHPGLTWSAQRDSSADEQRSCCEVKATQTSGSQHEHAKASLNYSCICTH